MRLLHPLLSLATIALVACNHPVATPPGQDAGQSTSQSASITTAGGTVSLANGTSVTIPPGALSETTTITISLDPTAPTPAGTTVVGVPILLGPEGLQLAHPATVTLTFDPSQLPSGAASSQIVVATAPAGSGDFTTLATTVGDSTHVQAQTPHFSIFEPVVPASADAGPEDAGVDAGVDAGPNDLDAGTDAGIDAGTDAGIDCTGDGGCYACPPTTTTQFLNQCTGSQCSGFDRGSRIPANDLLADGGLPPLN